MNHLNAAGAKAAGSRCSSTSRSGRATAVHCLRGDRRDSRVRRRAAAKVKSEEEALRPLIEALGVEGETFAENIELLIFSTLVKCIVVRGQVEDISGGQRVR
jgi:hypothetical protein